MNKKDQIDGLIRLVQDCGGREIVLPVLFPSRSALSPYQARVMRCEPDKKRFTLNAIRKEKQVSKAVIGNLMFAAVVGIIFYFFMKNGSIDRETFKEVSDWVRSLMLLGFIFGFYMKAREVKKLRLQISELQRSAAQ